MVIVCPLIIGPVGQVFGCSVGHRHTSKIKMKGRRPFNFTGMRRVGRDHGIGKLGQVLSLALRFCDFHFKPFVYCYRANYPHMATAMAMH